MKPEFVMITGGVAVGKTTLRRTQFASGYVVLDAAEIFLLLHGEKGPFPPKDDTELVEIGQHLADLAVRDRRNIVAEFIGESLEKSRELVLAMGEAGYGVRLSLVTCETESALERNLARGPRDISAFYTQDYHYRWLLNAARAVTTGGSPNKTCDGKLKKFVDDLMPTLAGYFLCSEPALGRTGYPSLPSLWLRDDELESVSAELNNLMPSDSMILSLWDWDLHFEVELSNDWYCAAAFGPQSQIEDPAEQLAEYFLQKVDEYDIDCNQFEDPDAFRDFIRDEARSFILKWRQNIVAHAAGIA
ncbi:MAG: hypothetical protein BWY59_02056 [Verrucomicrobia bacterium ADurb.Bin345]|nr:MAG: hypothetical protein BWY59_02056 [Verrucomicrobia bacterium ADurb.Bin345]